MLTPCPGCGALLAASDGPTHRYIGASPACWELYTALGVGEPAVAPSPAQIAAAPTPAARGALVDACVRSVWAAWAAGYAGQIAEWYERYVLPERLSGDPRKA